MMFIKTIYDNDFGCEERNADEKLKYIVILSDENNNETEILVEDEFLRKNNLDEGSEWNFPIDLTEVNL